jgi:hypothetical protein
MCFCRIPRPITVDPFAYWAVTFNGAQRAGFVGGWIPRLARNDEASKLTLCAILVFA